MSLEPPKKWKLYRESVRIGGACYAIPSRWCVLASDGRQPTDDFSVDDIKSLVVVGPRIDEKISVASAIEGGVLRRTAGRFGTLCPEAGTVQCAWAWSDTKGLLTTEEGLAGEAGQGYVTI